MASLAVPLIVILRRQLNNGEGTERSALCSGLILMTLLPMARHGRLAMLDGTLVSCSLLLISGWLSSKRWPWHGLLAGLGGSGILLLKPPALIGYLAMVGLITFLDRPTSRKSSALGWAMSGLIPGTIWHLWHLGQRGSGALVMWGGQGFGRVTEVVGENSGAWVMPLTEVLEGGWPWILLLPSGLFWAWRHRKTSTGLWELGLLVGSALMVLPLRTQLPWYSHLLWPPIALLCGEALARLLKEGRPHWVPHAWKWIGTTPPDQHHDFSGAECHLGTSIPSLDCRRPRVADRRTEALEAPTASTPAGARSSDHGLEHWTACSLA